MDTAANPEGGTMKTGLALLALAMLAAISCAAAVAAPSSVTGTWSGKYSGAYHGTFTLHWTQRKSLLTGTITLPQAGGTTNIKGSIRGSTINFGTVGSGTAITYTGTVSGSSMSGHYQTPGGGGPWSAHKT
jgi:opacity protein-like surface antigen